jgi:hypothetical protein
MIRGELLFHEEATLENYDVHLNLLSVFGVKNLPIFKLATKCKLKVCSLAPNNEMELKF